MTEPDEISTAVPHRPNWAWRRRRRHTASRACRPIPALRPDEIHRGLDVDGPTRWTSRGPVGPDDDRR
jgi:hypothetical protein